MKEDEQKMGSVFTPLMKLILCFMIPLIFVSVFVSFYPISNPSKWVFNSDELTSENDHKSQVLAMELRSKIDEVIIPKEATETEYSVFSKPPFSIEVDSPVFAPVRLLILNFCVSFVARMESYFS